MRVLIDANADGTRSEELRPLFENYGIATDAVKLFPQSTYPQDIVGAEDIPFDADVIFFGGPALMQHIREHRRWKPGGWCTFENFSCDVYYTYFGEYLANDCYSFLPAAEAKRQSQYLFERFAANGEIFARPAMGRKLFTGQKLDPEQFISTIDRCADPQSLIVIASPKRIEREWRIYVANSRVCTFSQYARDGEREVLYDCSDAVIKFAEMILANTLWRPDPIFSMDICECDGQIKLLEMNGFSCSNLYACDLNAIVDAVIQLVNHPGDAG